jgi:hypothetical protein
MRDSPQSASSAHVRRHAPASEPRGALAAAARRRAGAGRRRARRAGVEEPTPSSQPEPVGQLVGSLVRQPARWHVLAMHSTRTPLASGAQSVSQMHASMSGTMPGSTEQY